MTSIPDVIKHVVNNDLCIGCGLCVDQCPEKALIMKWDKNGFLTPVLVGKCEMNGNCIKVCPFNPQPECVIKSEDELSGIFLKDNPNENVEIGKYTGIYAGYASEFRETSSSGGLATYYSVQLLKRGIVDYIISVKESNISETHFEYSINSTIESLLESSKTKYYPVTFANVFPEIRELKGKVAIVGVPCFIKAFRLLQFHDPELRDKVPFAIGIICGGIKSRFFTEYLAAKAGVTNLKYENPRFRIKDFSHDAGDYSFSCRDSDSHIERTIKMRSIGDMWGTGLFKANACDFCDDVAAELADVSLGDAWIEPYRKDGKGTNVIITRSRLADDLISEGITSGELKIDALPPSRFIASQQGSYNHRRKGLPIRIANAKKNNRTIPIKRYENHHVSLLLRVIQHCRMKVRRSSLEIWKNTQDPLSFDEEIKKDLATLQTYTRFNHIIRKSLKKANQWLTRT